MSIFSSPILNKAKYYFIWDAIATICQHRLLVFLYNLCNKKKTAITISEFLLIYWFLLRHCHVVVLYLEWWLCVIHTFMLTDYICRDLHCHRIGYDNKKLPKSSRALNRANQMNAGSSPPIVPRQLLAADIPTSSCAVPTFMAPALRQKRNNFYMMSKSEYFFFSGPVF